MATSTTLAASRRSRHQRKYLGRDATDYTHPDDLAYVQSLATRGFADEARRLQRRFQRRRKEAAYLAALPPRIEAEIDRRARQNQQHQPENPAGFPGGYADGSVGSVLGIGDCACFSSKANRHTGRQRRFHPSAWCPKHGPEILKLEIGKVFYLLGDRHATVKRTRSKPSRDGFWWEQADGSWIVVTPGEGMKTPRDLERFVVEAALGALDNPPPSEPKERQFDPDEVTYALAPAEERRLLSQHGLALNGDGTWRGGPPDAETFRAFACEASATYRRLLRDWLDRTYLAA